MEKRGEKGQAESVEISLSDLDTLHGIIVCFHWVKWISYLFHLADIISSEANETIMQISSPLPSPSAFQRKCLVVVRGGIEREGWKTDIMPLSKWKIKC